MGVKIKICKLYISQLNISSDSSMNTQKLNMEYNVTLLLYERLLYTFLYNTRGTKIDLTSH